MKEEIASSVSADFDQGRRDALKAAGMVGVGGLLAAFASSSLGAMIGSGKTPPQAEGPFYPVKDQQDKDADMTMVRGRSEAALGQRVFLSGQVVDVDSGTAISGAMVEFWQACESGKYNHPRDPNTAPLDPNFQYWSQVRTDGKGTFTLKTIRPGAYPAGDGWVRPPHIHVKVHKPGYPSLTTQIYFAGDPLNDKDHILQGLTSEQQNLVVIDFVEGSSAKYGSILRGSWTVYLQKFQSEFAGASRSIGATPEID